MFHALPLPTGDYAVASIPEGTSEVTFFAGDDNNGVPGFAKWRGKLTPTTLFRTAREAELCALNLNTAPRR